MPHEGEGFDLNDSKPILSGLTSPLFVRLTVYPYSEPAYSRLTLGLELSLPARLAGGSRELQLQFVCLVGVRRPWESSVHLPSVRLSASCLFPPFRTFPPPASPILSTFFVHPSFFLLLLLLHRVLPPYPRARRRLLPLSKSPVETRYMQASFAHGYTWSRCIRMRLYADVCARRVCACACPRLFALSLSRKGDTTWSLGSATLRATRVSRTNSEFLIENVELA